MNHLSFIHVYIVLMLDDDYDVVDYLIGVLASSSQGSLPLPLQDYIGDTVKEEFRAWFNKQMVSYKYIYI